jgi:RNA polymerase sigma-70 factor (ECF subfamily)
MDSESLNQRLSQISTLWSKLGEAHAVADDAAAAARRDLLKRYCGAAYNYLLGAVRDEDTALDCFQEFAVRFLRGDFKRADPGRGRFRDYLKTALINLVTDYHRRRQKAPRSLPDDIAMPVAPEFDAEAALLESWRAEIITQTWAALARANSTFHAVLNAYVQQPDLTSLELAQRLAAQLDRPFTATAIRVTLHRAREKFAELLMEEVRQSLDSPTEEALMQELRELRLLELCRASPR